jgi:FAD binding domain
MMRNDVLIIGAGPSGLFAAAELARHGVGARLIEREVRPHREARATAIQPGTLEILETVGLLPPFLEAAEHVRCSRLYGPGLSELGATRYERLDWFRQISRQSGFLEWTVKPSPPHVASKNRGLQMEENTVLALLARNLTEPIERHSHAKSSSSLPCMIQADPALPGGLPYCQDRTASRRHSALM